jgi:crotonobetainyl-CoA:carnitine CoA-transferase CaiB-like acyl-CoA transferase
MSPTASSSRSPLAGLRILDLTRLLPGPLATQHLADYGAEVIKIEDTGTGDYVRTMGAMAGDTSYFYQLVNRNKKSLRLDLKQAEGRELLRRLAAGADALVEGFRPGVMDRLGLGYAALAELNPRLVYCSITGYGQSGPYAQRAGHDINYIGYAGVLDQIGTAGGPPAIPNLQIGDLLGGTLTALSALLAALLGAQRTGEGSRVDAAMTDGLLVHHIFPHSDLDAGVTPEAGRTLLTGGAPCYDVYETADGRHLAVGALELKFWQAFCDAAGLAPLRDRHWALGLAPGSAESDAVAAQVAARIRECSRSHWEQVFAKVDACVTPVLTPAEALAHAHHRARGLLHRRGRVTAVGPLAAIDTVRIAEAPAPRAGEHTREVLAELGLDANHIAAVLAARTASEAER